MPKSLKSKKYMKFADVKNKLTIFIYIFGDYFIKERQKPDLKKKIKLNNLDSKYYKT